MFIIDGHTKRSENNQRGMTLIEVMVALFILVTGVLGAVAMQASAKKGSFDAMQRSVASALAQDILERMRSNDALLLDAYSGTYGDGTASSTAPSPNCRTSTTQCSQPEMVTFDLYEWEVNLMGADVKNASVSNGGLVGAVACIVHANNNVDIVISWQGREETSDGASDNSTFAKGCGTASNKRRQVVVNAFIF